MRSCLLSIADKQAIFIVLGLPALDGIEVLVDRHGVENVIAATYLIYALLSNGSILTAKCEPNDKCVASELSWVARKLVVARRMSVDDIRTGEEISIMYFVFVISIWLEKTIPLGG